jgi:hypothetical protein
MRKMSVLLLLLWLLPATAADTLQCIAHPKRVKACPHLLYRVAQLPDMTKPAIICICVSDFRRILTLPATESEQIQFNMTKSQFAATYGAKLQGVLDILQRKN